MNFFLTTLQNGNIKKLEVGRRKGLKPDDLSDFIENYIQRSFNVPLPASNMM
jgi:hypothetical protein